MSVSTINYSIARKAVEALNKMYQADPTVITALIHNRIESSIPEDKETPAVYMEKDGKVLLGMLGVVVGVVEYQTGLRICAVFDDADATKFLRFDLIEDVKLKSLTQQINDITERK